MFDLLIQSFVLFLLYVAVHIGICHISISRFVIKAAILFATFSLFATFYLVLCKHYSIVDILIFGLNFYFFWALYIIVLVNAQNSFSLGAIQVILNKKSAASIADMSSMFRLDDSLSRRLEILKANGLISEHKKDYFELTIKGKKLAKTALFIRKILGITDVG